MISLARIKTYLLAEFKMMIVDKKNCMHPLNFKLDITKCTYLLLKIHSNKIEQQ